MRKLGQRSNNFAKSSCRAFGVSDQWAYGASKYLNCNLMSFPFTYLGIPISVNPRRCQTWEPIITKCERKLARWRQRHLSFGGRVTLINSVLTSILIYFFSFFRVPKQVVDKLVRLQRNFLWGGTPEQNKIAWIRWDTVCKPKEEGGLGVKDITAFNTSLLGKWKWDLFQNKEETWARVLQSKYGSWRNPKGAPRAWRLLKDRLPTRDNLRRKRVELHEYVSPLCKSTDESASHLFFHCSKILPIWWESLSWVKLVGAFPHHPRHHFLQHSQGVYQGLQGNRWT